MVRSRRSVRDMHGDVEQFGVDLFGRVFVGDGPARRARSGAEGTLQAQVIDLDDDAVKCMLDVATMLAVADAQRLPIGQCPACQANIARPDVLRKWEIGVTALAGHLLQQLPGGAVRAGFQRIAADLRFLFDIPRAAALMAVQVLRVVHRQCFIRKIHLYGVDVADLLQIHRKPLTGSGICAGCP